ncbi:MAG: DUF4058 family protein, partial [Planctomycetales bacterium]|nr:DUF4058 family protein [Planctomycetales bacterium]
MPLHDHFNPPISARHSWEGFHGGWPMTIVQQLARVLPAGYSAEPRVHLGSFYEIDVSTFEDHAWQPSAGVSEKSGDNRNTEGGAAVYAPPLPTLVVEANLNDEYEYEVLIHDHTHHRQLVAAIEIVSPANKDRPRSRQAFVAKCAALLQKRVCVSIVDLVTTRQSNLYLELLSTMDADDPDFQKTTPTYAATCRGRCDNGHSRIEAWSYPLAVGESLPSLPIW